MYAPRSMELTTTLPCRTNQIRDTCRSSAATTDRVFQDSISAEIVAHANVPNFLDVEVGSIINPPHRVCTPGISR